MIDIIPTFKPGDLPPIGYREWHEWAEVQALAGLVQRQCPACKLWLFPQETTQKTCRARKNGEHFSPYKRQ